MTSTSSTAGEPERSLRRWRFQYRLRTLILATLFTAIGMGVLTTVLKIRRASAQREVVAEITHLGGTVRYDLSRDEDGNDIGALSPPSDSSLSKLFGGDINATPAFAQLFTSEQLRKAAALTSLRWIRLSKRPPIHLNEPTHVSHGPVSWITDSDLEHLTGFGQLEELDASRTGITDAGLKYILGLRRLRVLRLDSTRVSDTGAKQLIELPETETLGLGFTKITDEGLYAIGKLPHLKNLFIPASGTTDAGLGRVAALPNLESLDIRFTLVTDVRPLAACRSLKLLYVEPKIIDDAGLEILVSLSKLQELDLNGSRVTTAGRLALSRCHKLKVLELGEANDDVLGAITSATELERLSVDCHAVSQVGIARLNGFHSLHALWLMNAKLNGAELEQLASIDSLRWLRLDSAMFRDVRLEDFARFTRLDGLTLINSNARLTPSELGRLRVLLPRCDITMGD